MNKSMRRTARMATAVLAAGTLVGGAAISRAAGTAQRPDQLQLHLTPSSPQLAACMPNARVDVNVELKTNQTGRDVFEVRATGLPPDTSFATFLLQQAGAPFGAAEYIGDFTSDRHGRAHNTFKLIVQEAFASTVVNGNRVRVDLNQIGAWFADPTGDDFCLGPNSPITPFDGDGQAGVQAFNSANTLPLPPP
jgi:hypothetical protein